MNVFRLRYPVLIAMTVMAVNFDAAPVRADEGSSFLRALAGNWRGRGVARETLKSAATAVACTLVGTLSGGGTKLRNSGQCATTQGSGPVSGGLSYNRNSKVISGNMFNSRQSDVRVSGSGRVNGTTLVMRVKVRNNDGLLSGQGTLSVRQVSVRSLKMILVVKDLKMGKRFEAMRLTMTKR